MRKGNSSAALPARTVETQRCVNAMQRGVKSQSERKRCVNATQRGIKSQSEAKRCVIATQRGINSQSESQEGVKSRCEA